MTYTLPPFFVTKLLSLLLGHLRFLRRGPDHECSLPLGQCQCTQDGQADRVTSHMAHCGRVSNHRLEGAKSVSIESLWRHCGHNIWKYHSTPVSCKCIVN